MKPVGFPLPPSNGQDAIIMPAQRFIVTLTPDEREQLEALTHSG
jgi:hypothetical protein